MIRSRAGRAAVLVPGALYSVDGPLLMYARMAVQRRSAVAHGISWTVPGFADVSEERAWVAGRVAEAVDEVAASSGVAAPVVIGKSLASLAAPLVADRGLAAVWLTPLLTDGLVIEALRRATGPCLLVGGTADELWDGQVARALTSHVTEIEGADHGMFVPGALAESAAVLGRVMTAVEEFLDGVVWAQEEPDAGSRTEP